MRQHGVGARGCRQAQPAPEQAVVEVLGRLGTPSDCVVDTRQIDRVDDSQRSVCPEFARLAVAHMAGEDRIGRIVLPQWRRQ
jgi:hypothetical protein